ncbi:DUF2267 domain-containing protein [Streptomyces sp. B3I8]|uniref:DUF2267 domain-containing protein n=1 Tax=Streptomyces sp. B3I8 TaxID=3042303 RepID=UPI0027822530|nr:DUF2267 domain-containing protein [Streptomyces sp. B3I8]MDQ0787217.1 uncharacterized protein (DUF2267 family) [Streptomyces sp. B3I8]
MTTPTTLTTVPAQTVAHSEPAPAPSAPSTTTAPAPAMARRTWEQLIDAVGESGQYATAKEAERVTRTVLSALGGHVTGEERVALVRHLPERAARLVAAQIPVTSPLTAAEFVDYVAARIDGATPATARWDVSSVLAVLPQVAGEDIVDRVLAGLPSGYALLFGRPELLPAA